MNYRASIFVFDAATRVTVTCLFDGLLTTHVKSQNLDVNERPGITHLHLKFKVNNF